MKKYTAIIVVILFCCFAGSLGCVKVPRLSTFDPGQHAASQEVTEMTEATRERAAVAQERHDIARMRVLRHWNREARSIHPHPYMYQVQQSLHNAGFQQVGSGCADCPDGSKQPWFLYRRRTESGFIVEIKLQHSYALGSHYAWVDVR